MKIKKFITTILLSILIVMTTGCVFKPNDSNYSTNDEKKRMLEISFFNQLKSEINTTDTLDFYFTDLNSDGHIDVIMRPVENVTSTAMGIFQQMYFWVYNGEKFVKVSDIDNFSEEYEFGVNSYESRGGLVIINGAYSFCQGTDSSLPEKIISNDIIRVIFSADKMPMIEAKRIMYKQKNFQNDTFIRAYVSKSFVEEIDAAVNEIPEWSNKKYYAVSQDEYQNIYEKYLNTLVPKEAIEYGRFTAEERNQYTSEMLVEMLVPQKQQKET